MLSANQVANWMLTRAAKENVCDITNMKLNKLVFFAQAHYLAATGCQLFPDPILAWDHGPVIESVYKKYCCYGSHVIAPYDEPPALDAVQKEILNQVFSRYGNSTASQLRGDSHTPLWRACYQQPDRTIPVSQIRDYYYPRSGIKSSECVYFTDAEIAAMDSALATDEQLADARALLGIC